MPARVEKGTCEKGAFSLDGFVAHARDYKLRARLVTMVMWRCLILVGAALARRDARRSGNLQEKVDAVASALDKGEFSVLSDVEAMRGIHGRYAGNTYPCQLGDAWWWSPGFGRDDCPEGGFFRRPARGGDGVR